MTDSSTPSSSTPSPAELLQNLEEISGVEDLRTDVRLADLGVDSMDVLQWLLSLEDQLDIQFDDLLGEDAEKAFDDSTLDQMYAALVRLVEAPPGDS